MLPEVIDCQLQLTHAIATVTISAEGSFKAVAETLSSLGYVPHAIKDSKHLDELKKKENHQDLPKLSLHQAKKYLSEGHFAKGSMGPKIQAAINFLEQGGQKVIITSIDNAVEAIVNQTGTEITRN